METLRSAGDAGGEALLQSFAEWAADHDAGDLSQLPVEDFRLLAAEFLTWCGWGEATLSTDSDELIEVSIANCWESSQREGSQSGCHLTTGLLHGFFAALAGYELGVMEMECAGLGSGGSCRFIVGTPEMVDTIYAGLNAGARYEDIIGAAG